MKKKHENTKHQNQTKTEHSLEKYQIDGFQVTSHVYIGRKMTRVLALAGGMQFMMIFFEIFLKPM